jgi:conjugal transfer pilus assembly protein TraE
MKLRIQNSFLQHAIRRRNGYLALACGSLVVNILLGMILFSMVGREKTILLPPKISQSFWVEHGDVSPEYLAEMGQFFTTLRFNITASNMEMQRDMLLRYVSPEYYAALKIELINDAGRMAREHVASVFYPVDIKVDAKRLETLVTGDLIAIIGTNQLPAKRITYKVSYSYNNYRLLVKKLTEVIPDA